MDSPAAFHRLPAGGVGSPHPQLGQAGWRTPNPDCKIFALWDLRRLAEDSSPFGGLAERSDTGAGVRLRVPEWLPIPETGNTPDPSLPARGSR